MKSFSGVMSRIGVDLGSSRIRMYAGGRIVLSENSVAVLDHTGEAVGFGVNALVRYHGATDKYHLEWPVKHGVITDYALTKGMLQYFLEKVMHRAATRPSVMLAIPSGTSSVVRHALIDAVIHAGAQHGYLISAPAAAVLGAKQSLTLPEATLSVVVGRDVTDCGLFSCGGIIAEEAIPFGGYNIDVGICQYMMEHYGVIIGIEMAKNIKEEMASVVKPREETAVNVKGRRAEDGVEVLLTLTSRELYPVMQFLLLPVTRLIKRIVRRAEPEMAEDFLKNGMLLSGGSALLTGISDWIASEIGIPVLVAEEPDNVVAAGCFAALNDYRRLTDIIEDGELYYGGE